jgi:hypothetical protein
MEKRASAKEAMEVEGRRRAIDGLEEKYQMKMNRKKRRTLMEMSEIAFEAHKLGLEISASIRVSNASASSSTID